MTLKDISFDLGLARSGGLSKLVRRFGVDSWPKTRDMYYEPHLKDHVPEKHGWLSVWPDWVVARLLSLSLGPDLNEEDAIKLIDGPIRDVVERFVKSINFSSSSVLPELRFSGRLEEGVEACQKVWKISSQPEGWVSQLRQEVRDAARNLGFLVQGLMEEASVVHIVIRGKYMDSGAPPRPPSDCSEINLTLEASGFRRRREFGCGNSEPFGAVLKVRFGSSEFVTDSDSGTSLFLTDLQDADQFPTLSGQTACKRQIHGAKRSSNATTSSSNVLKLHPSTQLPLHDDLDVGIALSLEEADRSAVQLNAPIVRSYAQVVQSVEPEPLVLFSVSREPKEYHQMMENLETPGLSFLLPGGGYGFVRPGQYTAAVKAIELGLPEKLTPHHVLVAKEYKGLVIDAIQSFSKAHKVKRKGKSTMVPMALASAEATPASLGITVSRTFIDVKIESSLYSAPGSSCVATASTTDVHLGKNPRKGPKGM